MNNFLAALKEVRATIWLGLIVLVLLIFAARHCRRATGAWEESLELKGRIKQLEKEAASAIAAREKRIADLMSAVGEYEEVSKKSSERMAKLEQEKKDLRLDLAKKSEKIPDMDEAEVLGAIGGYIGKENVSLYRTGFTLTRPGAEKTIFIFYERDSLAASLEKQTAITEEYRAKTVLCDSLISKAVAEATTGADEAIGTLEETLKMVRSREKSLERALASQKWKSRIEGGVGGVIIVVVAVALFGK